MIRIIYIFLNNNKNKEKYTTKIAVGIFIYNKSWCIRDRRTRIIIN